MEDLKIENHASKPKPSNSKREKPLHESYKFNVKTRPDLEINSPFIVTKPYPVKNSDYAKTCSKKKTFDSKPEFGRTENFISTSMIKSKITSPKCVRKANPRIKSAKSTNKSGAELLPITDYRRILEKENVDVSNRKPTRNDKHRGLRLEETIQTHPCRQYEREISDIFNSKFVKVKTSDGYTTAKSRPTDNRKIYQKDDYNFMNLKLISPISRGAYSYKKVGSLQAEPVAMKPNIINLPRNQSEIFSSSWKTNSSRVNVREKERRGKHIRIDQEHKTPRKVQTRKKPSRSCDEVTPNPSRASMTTFQATLLRAAYRVAARQVQLQIQAEEMEKNPLLADIGSRLVYPKCGEPIANVHTHYREE